MKKVIFFLLFTGVAVGEQYLCVPEHSTGFSYDNVQKEWKNTKFKTDHKYLISERDGTEYAFYVTRVGDPIALSFCESDFNESGFLSCSGIGEFHFNKKNGRYLYSYSIGYYNVLSGKDEGADTPYLEIGKCSPF